MLRHYFIFPYRGNYSSNIMRNEDLPNFPCQFSNFLSICCWGVEKTWNIKNELSKARSDILAWLHNINKSSLKWMCYHRWRIEKKSQYTQGVINCHVKFSDFHYWYYCSSESITLVIGIATWFRNSCKN